MRDIVSCSKITMAASYINISSSSCSSVVSPPHTKPAPSTPRSSALNHSSLTRRFISHAVQTVHSSILVALLENTSGGRVKAPTFMAITTFQPEVKSWLFNLLPSTPPTGKGGGRGNSTRAELLLQRGRVRTRTDEPTNRRTSEPTKPLC